jgi:hypothetical protein
MASMNHTEDINTVSMQMYSLWILQQGVNKSHISALKNQSSFTIFKSYLICQEVKNIQINRLLARCNFPFTDINSIVRVSV